MIGAGRQPAPGGESFGDRAFRVAAEAYTATHDGWEQSVRSALAGLLEFLAREPHSTAACMTIVGDATRGRQAELAASERLIDRFADLLDPGLSQAGHATAGVVVEAVSGGIIELIRMHVLEGEVDRLPAALPDATLIVLTPFVGAARAEELASVARPRRRDR